MSITYDGTIYEEISVDVSQQNEFAPRLVKQGDAYTHGYIITLTKNGEPLTIPTANNTAWFNCRNKTDPTKRASETGTINANGTVTVKVPTVVMEVAGFIQCDVSIITASGNDTNILKSTLFYLNCEEAANPDGTTTAAEDSILAGIAAGTIVPPAGPYVPKIRQIAGLTLENNIQAKALRNAIDAGKVTLITAVQAVPTSSTPGEEGEVYLLRTTVNNEIVTKAYRCYGKNDNQYIWKEVANRASTLAGYGITDGVKISDAYETGATVPSGGVAENDALDGTTIYRYHNINGAIVANMICISRTEMTAQIKFAYDGGLRYRTYHSETWSTWNRFATKAEVDALAANTYTKADIDMMIGDVETLLSQI